MLTLYEIFAILFIHWVADFIFQDEKWALGKARIGRICLVILWFTPMFG